MHDAMPNGKADRLRAVGATRPALPPSSSEVAAVSRPRRDSSRFDLMRDAVPWLAKVLTKHEGAMLVELWNRAPRGGAAFRISHARLAEAAGIRREHAARAVRSLERLGLVQCIRRGRLGDQTANEYRLPARLPSPPASALRRTSASAEMAP